MGFAVLLLAVATAAQADQANDAPVTASVTAGALATLTGDTDAAIGPTTFLEVDGPFALGSGSPWARIGARIGISSEPGERIGALATETFRSAEVAFTVGRVVGHRQYAPSGQDIATTLLGEWGFATRLKGGGEGVPLERTVRHFGVGVRVEERVSGASLTVLLGRDQAAGERGIGQTMLYGTLPLVGEDGLVFLVGDATLSVGARDRQRDVLRLGLVLSLDRVVERLRR